MDGAEPILHLTLVRHGETEWTELGRLHGRLDSPLSPTGIRHAESTAERLRGRRFQALYTSPLGRASQTAAILGEAVGLASTPLPGLSEMDFGWAEGLPLRHVDPDGTGTRIFRPLVHLLSALTAERSRHFANRVSSSLAEIQERHPHGQVLAVTHWAVLSMLMCWLKQGNHHNWRRYGPWAACGITELQAVNGEWQVTCLNDHSHIQ